MFPWRICGKIGVDITCNKMNVYIRVIIYITLFMLYRIIVSMLYYDSCRS